MTSISSTELKSITANLGADRCGIAPAERFDGAPNGFHPRDVYSKCKSVMVFLKQMPPESIQAENPVVYAHTSHILYDLLDKIGLKLCYTFENRGIHAVLVPTDVPYLEWNAEKMHGMGLISMRHAARNAGLGILGRNTLLINREMGNMVYIGAILVDAALEPDPIVTGFDCPPDCSLCLDACPVKALDGITANQKRCRKYSILQHPRGWDIYTCSKCRAVCPYKSGAG
ncbi:MAG: epoxyqueuosine reductase [Bacteroidales bacterium]|nr:epoxyqueuosine reductase [Bacteroidales bacterium]